MVYEAGAAAMVPLAVAVYRTDHNFCQTIMIVAASGIKVINIFDHFAYLLFVMTCCSLLGVV